MEAGTLISWRVTPGDQVKRGDVIATVETDKAAIDVEVWENGTVTELLVAEGTRVPVGTPLARIVAVEAATQEAGGAVPAAPAATEEPAPGPVSAPAPPPPIAPTQEATASPAKPRVRATPLARATAEQLGVDLATVQGTGPDAAVTHVDVEHARAARPTEAPHGTTPEPAPTERVDRAAALRRAIAAAMSRSRAEIPHYYLSTTVDLSNALDWLERTNRERSVQQRLIPAALFVKAVALATTELPELNGHWVEGGFRQAQSAHVGFAIAIPGGGLIAPAVLDARSKDLQTLMTELRELVNRARAGSLRSSEMNEATITVTSLGERGAVDAVFGLINPPQVALVGFGSIVERPWAEQGMLAVRRQVTISLSGDHRASDGHRGALFLAAVRRLLQSPEEL
jgi:pyruvate dehydrogenase E2 component (dihydrolipoamide acetyltransferase)